MKLFHSPNSCSQAPYIMVTELGLKCEIVPVDFSDRTELLKFNPRGQVPTLVLENGQVLTEGAVIMQYLVDQKPESKLLPKQGTWERYKAIEAMNYVATEFHKGIGALFAKEIPEDGKKVMKNILAKKLSTLNTFFDKNQYIGGTTYAPADAYCFVVMNWTKWVGIDMKPYPKILGYCERIGMRPAVQKVVQFDNQK
jgi:glutathione S-transferase